MNDTLTDKEIQGQFAKLPPDIQKAIQSNDAGRHIEEVGKKYQLHIDQMGGLKDATYLVMLGFEDPGEFVDAISEMCNVSKEVAQKIAGELSEQLFVPIRASMRKFMEEQDGAQPANTATTTSVQKPTLPPLTAADNMLNSPTISPSKKIEIAPQPATKPYDGTDPYREPTL